MQATPSHESIIEPDIEDISMDSGSHSSSSVPSDALSDAETPPTPIPSDLTLSDSSADEQVFSDIPSISPALTTYKLVGDSIDKNVRPREMRSDHQTQSLHYFHTYAVRDRIDLSDFSNSSHLPDISSIQLTQLLPSEADIKAIYDNFSILVGRVLKKYIPFFASYMS